MSNRHKDEKQWKEQLTDEQYAVLRKKGTERPFTGKYLDHKESGTYTCAGCGAQLFSSDAKFDSGTGWPSFTEPANTENIEFREDLSHGMVRTEVVCKNCGGHLGHVFDVGSQKGEKHFCINSCSLDFDKQ